MTKEEVEIMVNDKLIVLKEQLMKEIRELDNRMNEAERDIRNLNVYGGKYV